jgi:predicted molibdopterin-dependent oxidoreductase YjgC
MTLHFPDEVDTNVLTLDTWDTKSGTAEFKATAIRVERLVDHGENGAGRSVTRAGDKDKDVERVG